MPLDVFLVEAVKVPEVVVEVMEVEKVDLQRRLF
jgi:hypothetical protein